MNLPPKGPARSFAILVAVAVLAMVTGLLLGRTVRSPAQQALDTRAPGKSIITAPVTQQQASASVTVRGTVRVGQTVSVGPIQASTPSSIVTGVYVGVGDRVRPGDRLLEVSGRPVLLLRGAFGAYRDLRAGDRGPDAAQVNKALRGLGYRVPPGSVFTSATASALTRLYHRFGYAPPPGGGLDRREVAFVPDKSAVVARVGAVVGAGAGSPGLVVLSSGPTSVTANMDPGSARAVRQGASATIYLDGSGGSVPAAVSAVTIGADLPSTTVELTPSSPLPASQDGADVRVEVQQRSGEAGRLAVPVTAVFSRADGQTAVIKVSGSAQQVVPVTVGAAVGGFVTISVPGAATTLKPGDQVEVSGPGLR